MHEFGSRWHTTGGNGNSDACNLSPVLVPSAITVGSTGSAGAAPALPLETQVKGSPAGAPSGDAGGGGDPEEDLQNERTGAGAGAPSGAAGRGPKVRSRDRGGYETDLVAVAVDPSGKATEVGEPMGDVGVSATALTKSTLGGN